MNDYINDIEKDLTLMLNLLGLQGEIKKIKQEAKFVTVKLFSKEPGRIIGRHGSALDALTLLLNNILYNRNKKNRMRVVIDIEGGKKKSYTNNEKSKSSTPRKSNKVEAPSNPEEHNETTFIPDHNLTNIHKDDLKEDLNITTQNIDSTIIKKTILETKSEINPLLNNKINAQNNNASNEDKKETEKAATPKLTRTQMQCRNAIKEVKRWGEPVKVANVNNEDFEEIKEFFKNDKEVKITYDKIEGSSKGRVLIELS